MTLGIKGLNEIHRWKDLTNRSSVSLSLKQLLLYFERTDEFFMNCNISGNPVKESYTVADLEKYVSNLPDSEKLISVLTPLISDSVTTKQYVTRCSRCEEWYCASLNTFVRREGLYCKDCSADVKLIQENGSLLDARPDVIRGWSDKNRFAPDKCPNGGSNVQRRKYWVICPSCGNEQEKRMDAILRSGPSCGPCAKRGNVSFQNSLRSKYPSLAVMFDKAENLTPTGLKITSDKISATAHGDFNFYCDNGGVPHVFSKSLVNMAAAHASGRLGCPICAGFMFQSGVNDFATRVPELSKYWDSKKNGFPSSEVYFNDEKECWWVCPNGHSFSRDPKHMQRSLGTSTLGCPVCHGKEVRTGVNDLSTIRPDLLKYWDYDKNIGISPNDLTSRSNKEVWWKCTKCSKSFLYDVDRMSVTNGLCEECRLSNYSKSEKEVVNYIRSLGFMVEEEAHIYSNPAMSCDIYIPSKKIAIEYNGLYWHSDAVREDSLYHYKKYADLKKRGIFQYTIWEDDYLNPVKREVIFKTIARMLGVSNERKVNARDCSVEFVDKYNARVFLEANHIQGFVSGTDYVGLIDRNTSELVAIAVFLDTNEGFIRLSRYATSCNVRGGFSKIVSTIEECNRENYGGILTFSDNLISSGNLYARCGFTVIEELKPDYMYFYEGVRVHKFNFRKDRFERDSKLLYTEGMTERQLAEMNGISRIYDAGKLKWYYKFNRG